MLQCTWYTGTMVNRQLYLVAMNSYQSPTGKLPLMHKCSTVWDTVSIQYMCTINIFERSVIRSCSNTQHAVCKYRPAML